MDAALCERLWREHADRLLLYAAALLSDRSAAEDVLQNVFARMLAAEPSIAESEAAYLFRAVRNEAMNASRGARRARAVRERLFETEPAARDESERLAVEEALADLPEDQREAVVLKIWGGLSFPEAARVLGTTDKTVEHRYYRGLAALEEKLR